MARDRGSFFLTFPDSKDTRPLFSMPSRVLSFREHHLAEARCPRRTLLGHLQHPKVTRPVDPVRCLRGSPFGIRPFGGCEFRPFGGGPISLLLPLSRGEEIGEQRQTNGSRRHRDGSAQNPTDPSRSPPFLQQSPSGTE